MFAINFIVDFQIVFKIYRYNLNNNFNNNLSLIKMLMTFRNVSYDTHNCIHKRCLQVFEYFHEPLYLQRYGIVSIHISNSVYRQKYLNE